MTTCPEQIELRNLLTGEIASDRREEIDRHVEDCGACQQTLDHLTDESTRSIPGLSKRASRKTQDASVSRLMSRLQESPPFEALSDDTSGPLSGDPAAQRVDEVVEFPGDATAEAPLGTLGPYRIIERIGGGSTGLVYKAIDTRLERPVAIKVLRRALAVTSNARARLEREARAAASLNHDNIVTLYQIADQPNFPPYLVMEFVEGESLRDSLKRETTIAPIESARLVRDIALAVSAAGQTGLVHRDIKPSNILIEKSSGRPKISDFGLACAAEPTNRLTVDGAIAGTPAYMSPEQIERPDRIDIRSDVYALGVVLYELLTGDVPFRGVVRMIFHQVLHDEPQPPRQLNDALPRDLETICLKAIAKEPTARYQTPRELADDLDRWARYEPILARPVSPWGRLRRWCKRSPRVAALSAIVVVLLLSVVGVSLTAAAYLAAARNDAQTVRKTSDKNAAAAAQQRDVALKTLQNLVFQIHDELEDEEVVLEEAQRKLLRLSLDGLQRIARNARDGGDVDYSTAEAQARLGTILVRLEKLDDAERQFGAAQNTVRRMLHDSPRDFKLRFLLADMETNLGSVLMMREQYGAARSHFENAQSSFLALAEERPTDEKIARAIAEAQFQLGEADYYADNDATAAHAYRNCLDRLVRLAVEKPDDAQLVVESIVCRMSLGLAHYHAGDYEMSEQQFRTVLEDAAPARRRFSAPAVVNDAASAFGARQRLDQTLRCTLITHRHLGSIHEEHRQDADARREYELALSDGLALFSQSPWDTSVTGLVVTVFGDLISLANLQDESDLLRRDRNRLNDFLTHAIEDFPENQIARRALADNLVAIGVRQLVDEETAIAAQNFDRAVGLAETLYTASPSDLDVARLLIQAYAGIARVAEADGRSNDILDWLARANAVIESAASADREAEEADLIATFVKVQREFMRDLAKELDVEEGDAS